jgi:hypothetical protein
MLKEIESTEPGTDRRGTVLTGLWAGIKVRI